MEFTRLSATKELSEAEYSALFESARLRALAQAYGLLSLVAATALLIGFSSLGSVSGAIGGSACLYFIIRWRSFTNQARSYLNRLPPSLLKNGYVPGFWLTESSPALIGAAFILAFAFALWRQTDFQSHVEARLSGMEIQLTEIKRIPVSQPTPSIQDDLRPRIDKLEVLLKQVVMSEAFKKVKTKLEIRLSNVEKSIHDLKNPVHSSSAKESNQVSNDSIPLNNKPSSHY